ncbi:MAG: hypothetical protein WCK35_13650 [Chloroflexota bacterium]
MENMELLDLFKPGAENKTKIRLFNIFKGLPITTEASISLIGNSEITVACNRYQLSCLYHQRETFIQSPELPYIIRAQVMTINLSKEEATLSGFEITQNDIGNRMNIRVIPSDQLVGIFQIKSHPTKVIAPIADISIQGMSVFINNLLFPIKLFRTGDDVNFSITFPNDISLKLKKELSKPSPITRNSRRILRIIKPQLPIGNIEIDVRGKVLAMRSENKGFRHRVSLQLFLNENERMILSKYIALRQSEIIQDLRFFSEDLFDHQA